MEISPFLIQSKDVDSYEKHLELINAGYEQKKYANCDEYFYQHKDAPNLWEMKPIGRNLATRRRCLKYMLKDLTALEYKEYLAEILNDAASSKSIKLLSTVTHSIFNTRTALYELARMIASKNHNIAIHKSIDDDNQTNGVIAPFTSTQMESNK